MENLATPVVLEHYNTVQHQDLNAYEIRKELLAHTHKIIELLAMYEDRFPLQTTIEAVKTSHPLKDLKILCVGQSTLNRNEIFKIFNDAFYKIFGQNISKKSIEMPVLNYRKMKTFDFKKHIKANRYDFIIAGPRPHSTANKGINISLKSLKEHLSLKAITLDYNKDPLTKNVIEEVAETFALHYHNNNKH